MLRALVLVVLGALVGLAANGARSNGVKLAGYQEPVQCEGAGAPSVKEISPADAAALCGKSDVLIADTRPENRFAEGHVAGAIHLPCDAGGQVANEAFARLDGARLVIVYGERSEDARPVAETLQRRHATADIRVLEGGFEAWSKGGQACASGMASP